MNRQGYDVLVAGGETYIGFALRGFLRYVQVLVINYFKYCYENGAVKCLD